MPGAHVPAAGGAPDGEGDRHEHGGRGDHHAATALARGADGRAERAAVRAGEALVDPRPPPRARRERDVGGRLAPGVRLRRPEGGGDGGPSRGRADRRVHARQADRARARRGGLPRPPLPEPLLEPEERPHPLRRDHERLRARDGRRHHLSPRRRQLLRDDHVERRGRDLRLVHLVARRLAARRAHHRRDPGSLRREPRGPARARDHGQGHRPRLLGRGLHLPRRQAGRGGGRAVPDPPDRVRGGGGLRDPLPGRAGRAPLGFADGRRARVRGHAVRPRAAAAAAPPEDAHPRRAGHRLRVDAVRRRDAVDRQARQGAGLHRQVGAPALRERAAGDRAGRVHARERPRAYGGRRRDARERWADGPGHERALLAATRPRDWDGVGARGPGEGRRSDHDLRRERAHRRRGPDEALLRPRRGDPALMSLAFLSPGPGAVAKSPMEPGAVSAGASFEVRHGWKVATAFTDPDTERALCASSVGFADVSHVGKIEIQADADDLAGIISSASGDASLELGRATAAEAAWWCPYSAQRAVVLCETGDTAALRDHLTASAAGANGLASVIDTTTAQGAMTITGALARETFARFTAIDLRPSVTPVHAFRPGSVARTGGAILCEAPDRYLMLFGAALGQYVWTVVADAAGHLGGGPVGVDALEPIGA